MLPIRDDVPSGIKPWVTYSLIAVNVFIFLWQLIILSPFHVQQLYRVYGFTPAFFFEHINRFSLFPPWLTVLTSQFNHSGFSHILGNMLYLWVFGDNIEDELGHLPFLLFYLLGGACGALLHGVFNMTSTIPLIGASGAIAAILGAYFVLYPRARVRSLVPLFFFYFTINVPAVLFLGAWFILQVFNNSISGAVSTTAYLAHIGGFLVGVAVGLWLKRKRSMRWELLPPGKWEDNQQIPLQ
ncbi:MAG: rhomboid family intramembrane serine protease [Symbiobacteriaceae bacterium]|nr:rhomboid family intramembrane serine protease [Symbiobacteriaceae bacterium]